MIMKYHRGYDPEVLIDVVCISPERPAFDGQEPYLVLTLADGKSVDATYCDMDSDGLFLAGLLENF